MALAGTFERLKPDFAGVGQVPAGDQKVVPGRLLVAFEAKRGIGDDDAVENFAQRQRWPARWRRPGCAVDAALRLPAPGADIRARRRRSAGAGTRFFPLFQPLQHGLLQRQPVIGAPRAGARQQGFHLADRHPFFTQSRIFSACWTSSSLYRRCPPSVRSSGLSRP